jgi:hypothetical protein
MPGREDLAVLDERIRPVATNPSLVVIVLSERPMMRSPWKWKNAVPTYVNVTVCPVHGFTSWKFRSIGDVVGGSAAAGKANARATKLSRPTTSLITGLPPVLEGGTPRAR